MKKNISINISGIIFHIEEDGYETLRKYLDSIKRYFASFEDSSEILSDIENRIAEIFLAKLNEGKQVITAEDVNGLVATMGSVSDFQAAEQEEFDKATFGKQESGEQANQNAKQSTQSTAARKLVRDQKRKIFGGVCAGFGHYFNIDPIWPRLLFALLVLGSYGVLLLLYIILWIVLPASVTIEEEPSVRKMFRDSDKKIIGGVASGVAAFFGTDAAVIRILFVVFAIFGGLGVLIYIILWIALPEARSITDRIQMQGEPVTLSTIESSVKKSLNEKEEEEESVFVRIILFPFRLIAMILNGIVKVLGPVFRLAIEVLRVCIGLFFGLMGLTFILCLLFMVGVLLGLVSLSSAPDSWMYVTELGLPMEALRNAFPLWIAAFAFLALFIPSLMILLTGISIIAKRVIFNSLVGWSMFVLFFVSVIILSFSIPQIVYSFKEEGEYQVEKSFAVDGKIPVLRINEVGLDDYIPPRVRIKPHQSTDIKLIQRFESQGNTRKVAAENAKMIDYAVTQTDSVLIFDSNVTFKKEAKFRGQRVKMDLFVPLNVPFVIEEDMWEIIDNYDRYNYNDSRGNQTWKATENGLECITCQLPTRDKKIQMRDQFGLEDFNAISLSGLFDVAIQRGDLYSVELEGSEREKKRYEVSQDGETLVIEYNDKRTSFWKRDLLDDDKVTITITMPHLEKLNVVGAGKVTVNGFNEQDAEIKLTGALIAEGELWVNNLTLDITGTSFLELKGSGHFLEADITGASGLKAYNYEVRDAIVEVTGLSSAKVHVSDKLEIHKNLTSSVSHRGEPQIIKHESGSDD